MARLLTNEVKLTGTENEIPTYVGLHAILTLTGFVWFFVRVPGAEGKACYMRYKMREGVFWVEVLSGIYRWQVMHFGEISVMLSLQGYNTAGNPIPI